jgi:hypothetical protein
MPVAASLPGEGTKKEVEAYSRMNRREQLQEARSINEPCKGE